jgi:H+/Cl- antiporter ClcA
MGSVLHLASTRSTPESLGQTLLGLAVLLPKLYLFMNKKKISPAIIAALHGAPNASARDIPIRHIVGTITVIGWGLFIYLCSARNFA